MSVQGLIDVKRFKFIGKVLSCEIHNVYKNVAINRVLDIKDGMCPDQLGVNIFHSPIRHVIMTCRRLGLLNMLYDYVCVGGVNISEWNKAVNESVR